MNPVETHPGEGAGALHRLAYCSLIAVALCALAGCNTLDPSGEWRGLDRQYATAASAHRALTAPAQSPVKDLPAIAQERLMRAAPTSVDPNVTPSVSRLVVARTSDSSALVPQAVASNPPVAHRVDSDRLDQLLAQAEEHYRHQRTNEAEHGFREVLRRDPFALHAWFRLANLSHARHDLDGAALAYRKAIELKPRHPLEQDAREKSLANLAIIGLEQARIAIERLGERKNSTDARDRAGALAPVLEQRQAALQEEIARLAPRASPQAGVDSLGLAMSDPAVRATPGAISAGRVGRLFEAGSDSMVSRVRVESFLPAEPAVSGLRPSGAPVSNDRSRETLR